MKKFLILASLALIFSAVKAQTYLNPQAPIEERVKDALKRMTTEEKIKILHAQSKFTSAGVPRLGIRQLYAKNWNGPPGVQRNGPTTISWPSLLSPAWQPRGTVTFPTPTAMLSVRSLLSEARILCWGPVSTSSARR